MRDWIHIGSKFARRPTGTLKMLREFIAERSPVYGFTSAEILARDRRGPVVIGRHGVMADAYATGRWSFLTLGRGFERDHSTVVHAVLRARALAQREAAA